MTAEADTMNDNSIALYHFGIIDYLQTYTPKKGLERCFKRLTSDGDKISVAPPSMYQMRFLLFIEQNVFSGQLTQNESKTKFIRQLLRDVKRNYGRVLSNQGSPLMSRSNTDNLPSEASFITFN